MSSPAIQLYDYQKRWLLDRSRFKHGRWARQTGKSFICTLEAVDDCNERKTEWVFLSRGERQARRLIAEAKKHAMAYQVAADEIEGIYSGDDKDYRMLELHFPNGSAIYGLPANPDTARGWSANVFLDEFAFHKDSRGIWTALYPTITRGYKIRVVSTPNGKKNKFYELEANEKFKHHLVDLYQAVAGGLVLRDEEGQPITADDLMAGMGDQEAADQEYLCLYIDEATAYITFDLINECEDPELDKLPAWAEQLIGRARAAYDRFRETKKDVELDTAEIFAGLEFGGDLYLGMDIGRRRDLTVLWLDEKIGRISRSVAVLELARTPFHIQKLILHALLRLPKLRRFCGDETGIGAQLIEGAQDVFGSWKVEGITFTSASKEVLAGRLKESMEDHRRVFPADRAIRNSIHSVKRYATPTGHFRFDADRTEETGHADMFWSAALAEMAATGPSVEAAEIRVEPEEVKRGETRRSLVFGERRNLSMREAVRGGNHLN